MTPIKLTSENQPLLLIATPSHDHKLNVCMAVSLMNLMASRKVSTKIFIAGQSGISKARNHSLWNLLNESKDATHILFWDSDIQVLPEMVTELVARNLPVVGWLYAHKSENLRWCMNIVKPDGCAEDAEVEPIKEGPLAGLIPVETLGTGGMLVQRSAIEKIIELFGEELSYTEDQESDSNGSTPQGTQSYAFCQERMVSPNGPENKIDRIKALFASGNDVSTESIKAIVNEPQKPGRFLTEDWFLCKLFKRAGIPMYVETRFHVMHEGMARYPASKWRSSPWVKPAKPE